MRHLQVSRDSCDGKLCVPAWQSDGSSAAFSFPLFLRHHLCYAVPKGVREAPAKPGQQVHSKFG